MSAIAGAGPAFGAAAPQTWEYSGSGQWQSVVPTTQPQAQPEPALDRVEQLVEAGRYRDAEKRAIQWLKANRSNPQRDRALYLTAAALHGYGNRIRAFYYLDELLDTYPESRLFYPALEKQYQIADEYLNGAKRRLLGLPVLGAEDEAVEMLYRIQQRAPGSALAEKALLRTADHYYASSDFDFAADAYGAYARSYPRSPAVPRVRLRQAFASLAQFRGLRFDATPVIDAQEQLRRVQAEYPELAEQEKVPEILERMQGTFARKLYTQADYYRRTGEPQAAAYLYQLIQRNYPNTPDARRAERELSRLPQAALNQASADQPQQQQQ